MMPESGTVPQSDREAQMRRDFHGSKLILLALGLLLCLLPAAAQPEVTQTGLAQPGVTQPGVAQSGVDPLGPTSERLKALERCLPPGDPALEDLKIGLITGWNNWHKTERGPAPSPPSLEYSASLDRDIEACGYASTLTDPVQRAAILRGVAEDVDIKAKDCRKFGMSRKIEVHVSTLLGSTPENGWEVFYKWTGSSMFPAEELRIPNLTSPAIIQLPPGKYMFRAERRASANSAKSTQPVTIVVGSERTIECQLAIQ
jgi:hypothetical protein